MKALTLWQPWATLVMLGVKKVETRGWETKHRGLLVIHAALVLPKNWTPFARSPFVEALRPVVGLNKYGAPNLDRLPLGMILGTVKLVDVMPADYAVSTGVVPYGRTRRQQEAEATRLITPVERAFGNYDEPGRFAWFLEDVKPLPMPVPWRGHQRLWNLPDEAVGVDAMLHSNLTAGGRSLSLR